MTKEELVSMIAETRGLEVSKKDTQHILDLAFELIGRTIRTNRRFHLKQFGTFTVRTRKARMGTHPQTKRLIKIPAHRVVWFQASPSLKREL